MAGSAAPRWKAWLTEPSLGCYFCGAVAAGAYLVTTTTPLTELPPAHGLRQEVELPGHVQGARLAVPLCPELQAGLLKASERGRVHRPTGYR